MAKTSQIVRWKRPKKHAVSQHNRCPICGRSRAYLRRFNLCRICFRELAWQGLVPGVKKASW